MRFLPSFLSLFLIPLLVVMPLQAELNSSEAVAKSGAETAAGTTPEKTNTLKIRLADESSAKVEANTYVKGYAIQVSDSAGLPVADVAVAVRLPEDGATGYFVNGEHSAVAYTDASGVARFPQVNWGSTLGTASIRVTAVKAEMHAGAIIEQTILAAARNAPAPGVAPTTVPTAVQTPAGAATLTPLPDTSAAKRDPAPVTTAPKEVPRVEVAAAKKPGIPMSVDSVHSGATAETASIGGNETGAAGDTSVSVVNTSGSQGSTSSKKKWVILAAVLASAGLGAAVAFSAKGGAAAATTAASTGPTQTSFCVSTNCH